MENDLVPRRRNEKQLANKIATLSKEAAAATTKKGDAKVAEQLSKLRAEHGQVEAENRGAVAFFARHGFTEHGEALLVPGLRGPDGGRLHQQTMVWRP